MQTADSNTHSHERCCVTATSRTHHPSAPGCCFHGAGAWTHPTSKDGALHISCCLRPFRVCGHAVAELNKPLKTAWSVVTGPTRHLHRGLRCRGGLHGRAVTAQTEAASIPPETSAATFLPGAAPLVDTAGATLLRQRRPAISPQQTQHIGTGTNVASPRGHKQRRTHFRTRVGTDSKIRTPSITIRKEHVSSHLKTNNSQRPRTSTWGTAFTRQRDTTSAATESHCTTPRNDQKTQNPQPALGPPPSPRTSNQTQRLQATTEPNSFT